MQDNKQFISCRSDRHLSPTRQTLPRLCLAALALGVCFTILLTACTGQSSPGTSTSSAPSTSASTPSSTSANTPSSGQAPAVHMGVKTFVPSSITIPKGSKLQLIDYGSFEHILSNGQWENNTPQPAIEAGAPAVQNVQVNGNTIEVGPFTTAGTFHLYCTIHPGMNLTIVVQ